MIPASVMVVEDERVVALHLKQQLVRLGYQVPAMATSGEKALSHIATFRPDVVLMDVHLEGPIDGIETAQRIPPDLKVPIIYLTAYSEEATLERARETKPYGYLIKPFSERELHASIQMVLERRRADSALRESEHRLEQLVAERTRELVVANEQLGEQTTLRLQAERSLHEAQKMEALGQLTGGIAHDFNNVLGVIQGSVSVIERRPDQPREDTARMAGIALRAVKRGATLTERLLAFSRRQPLAPKPLDPNQVVAAVADTLSRTLGDAVVVVTTLGDGLWPVSLDANQFEAALLNLALNARDAMPGSGTLRIATANACLDEAYCLSNAGVEPGDYVIVTVKDTGVGMTAAVASKAFEPFFTTKGVGQGTGLGLSQVYGFMKQSGGHASLESEVGGGTTVTLYLPRGTEELSTPSPTKEASDVQTGTSGEIILVVEDDDDMRAGTADTLRELGYTVVEASEAAAALQILRGEQHISLLFTDIGLPGGTNGRLLADEARRLRPELPVLFTTGYASDVIVHGGRLDADVDLVPKPFTFPALAAKVRRRLDARVRS